MRLTTLTLTLALATACSDYEMSGSYDYDATDTDGWGDAYEDSEASDTEAEEDDDDLPPEEADDDFLAMMPSYTDTYVFIANPGRNTVTRVNVYTLEVDTTPVGNNPTAVETTPDYTAAVVFNEDDDTVSIIDADTLDTVTVDVRANLNTLEMAPDGDWVGLYHDMDAEDDEEDESGGVQAYNEFSLVNVETGTHFAYAVGFNPTDVQFTPDGSLCVVVSDAYLAVFDLTGDEPDYSSIKIAEDTIDPPVAQEVVISPDGTYAWVRQFGGEATLIVVDLIERTYEEIETGAQPTDLDLDPEGTYAVAVARGSHELWIYDVADPYVATAVLDLPDEVTLGSIAFDPIGNQAILYTTASATSAYAHWDLATDEITLEGLVKPIDTLSITPSGESMLVFHTLEDAEDAETGTPWYGHYALTLIDLTDHRPNPMQLPGEPLGYAHAEDGSAGYFIMDGEPYLEILDYGTLLYDELELHSNPVYVGVLPSLDGGPEAPAYVSQEHDLGRISFYHPSDGTLETITGFELNSEIED